MDVITACRLVPLPCMRPHMPSWYPHLHSLVLGASMLTVSQCHPTAIREGMTAPWTLNGLEVFSDLNECESVMNVEIGVG